MPDRSHLLQRFSLTELLHLLRLPATTPAALRFRRVAGEEWAIRQRWTRGRWEPLVWFARQERIVPADELPAMIERQRKEPAA